jgi:SAM-dependent methyltransferase
MRQQMIDRIQHLWLCSHIEGATLNVGCGVHPYPGAINIDPNPDRKPKPDFAIDVCHLPWVDACFDRIVSCHVLPALRDIDLAMREMIRVLKPGGYMAHVVPDWSVAPKRQDPRYPFDYQHQGWYSAEELRAFFEQYPQLRVTTCQPFPQFRWSFRVVAYRRWEVRPQ